MKPLIILIAVFAASLLISKLTTGIWNPLFGGNIAMCVMLCFTALGHFLFTRGMTMMFPPLIPYKLQLVYLTAFVEIVLGFALLNPALRCYAGYIAILFFILLAPANIYAAARHVNIEKGDHSGPGLAYLWFRLPLQLFFIGWVYIFAIMRGLTKSL